MFGVSMWIITDILQVFLAEGNPSTSQFSRAADGEGQTLLFARFGVN